VEEPFIIQKQGLVWKNLLSLKQIFSFFLLKLKMEKQRLLVTLIGQQAFGGEVLKKLRKDCSSFVEVVGVSAPKPKEGKKGDPLWEAATAEGFACVNTAQLKEEEVGKKWKDLDADLSILAFVTDIIPNEVLAFPRLGSIQYHPSLLPYHRGISSINWAVINQDEETGLSIFWVDQYIDHGPILIQKKLKIGPHDTVKTLYFNHLFPMGVEAIYEAVKMIHEGNIVKMEQDHKKATYEPPCKEPFSQIQWHQPAKQVYALIRGCDPQPGAYTIYNDKKIVYLRFTSEG
jgi:methionyl-tRNA formyltransferase